MTRESQLDMHFAYFAKSLSNNKVYVGRTDKMPTNRVSDHNNGSNEWTKHNGPFKLVYYESYICKEDSIARENFYKTGMGRKVKKAIVEVMAR